MLDVTVPLPPPPDEHAAPASVMFRLLSNWTQSPGVNTAVVFAVENRVVFPRIEPCAIADVFPAVRGRIVALDSPVIVTGPFTEHGPFMHGFGTGPGPDCANAAVEESKAVRKIALIFIPHHHTAENL